MVQVEVGMVKYRGVFLLEKDVMVDGVFLFDLKKKLSIEII
jgi:hypothetical protein